MASSSFLLWQQCFKDKVSGAFTTRTGGVSEAPYDSLNLGLHVGDNPEAVMSNRQRLEQAFGTKLVFMNQTHSSRVVTVSKTEDVFSKAVDADGLVCFERGIGLAVMTADCLPLLMSAADGSAVGAVHCGWRGLAGGIVENAVQAIRARTQSEIVACMGPAIGPESFEVGEDVREAFFNLLPDADSAFRKTASVQGESKYLCSLYALCTKELARLGISRVYGGIYDTFTQNDLFFSYRRDKKTGRMAGVIAII